MRSPGKLPTSLLCNDSARTRTSGSRRSVKRQSPRAFRSCPSTTAERARALLGLVPVRPRGQGKNRKKQGVAGLTRAESASTEQFTKQLEAVQDIDALRAIARQLDQERRQLRETLERPAQLTNEALS